MRRPEIRPAAIDLFGRGTRMIPALGAAPSLAGGDHPVFQQADQGPTVGVSMEPIAVKPALSK